MVWGYSIVTCCPLQRLVARRKLDRLTISGHVCDGLRQTCVLVGRLEVFDILRATWVAQVVNHYNLIGVTSHDAYPNCIAGGQ